MASLAEAIYGLPTERLRKLVQNRRVDPKKLALIPNKKQLAHFLAQELNRAPAVAETVSRCNARELRLLQLLVSSEERNTVPWPRLLEAAGSVTLEEPLRAVLTGLEERGLAFSQERDIALPEALKQYVPISVSDRYRLESLLNNYDATTLKLIRERLELPAERDTKVANIALICQHLLQGGPGLKLKRPLNEDDLDVLNYLIQSGGAAPVASVASATGQGRMDDFYRYDWQSRWKQGNERNAIDRLLSRGLIYVTAFGYGYNLYLCIPGDLLRALIGSTDSAFWTESIPAPETAPEPPAAISRAGLISRDVVAFLGFLATQEAARTNTGHIHKTALKNALRLFTLPEERYASFLYALCREAQLIAPHGEKQIYALTAKGNSWLHASSLDQTRLLFETWRGGSAWAEMDTEPLEKASSYRHKDAVLEIRQAALDILKEATEPAYYETESITETMTFRFPLLLSSSGMMGLNLVSSPSVFVRLLIGECLQWLGAAEISKEKEEGLTSLPETDEAKRRGGRPRAAAAAEDGGRKAGPPEFAVYRITPTGAWLLGLPEAQTPVEEPREDKFIVQANAEIFVPPYLAPATLYHLLMITDLPAKSSTNNTVALTRDSIRRALDRGESIRELLGFLQAHSRTGIPQNVEYLINEVGGKHGHIHVGKAVMYLQVDSPLLLQELQARRELKGYFVRTLSDTVALVNAEEPDKILRELRKAGYLPVSDDDTAPRAFRASSKPTTPAIRPAQTPQAKQANRAAKADSALDWDRIALDDAKPWSSVASAPERTNAPTDSVKHPDLIKFLMQQSIRTRQSIQIAYQDAGETVSTLLTVLPFRLTAGQLEATDLEAQETVVLSLPNIQWAKLTGRA